jgi:hypothetical protein
MATPPFVVQLRAQQWTCDTGLPEDRSTLESWQKARADFHFHKGRRK